MWMSLFWLSIIFAVAIIILNILAQSRFGDRQVFTLFKNRGPINGYNIIANITAQEKEKKILVLGAHYDTKSITSIRKKNEVLMLCSVLIVNLSFIIFVLLRIFISYNLLLWFTIILWIGSTVEFISVAYYTLNYKLLNESPGANDNGSGVAVVLELAEIFSKNPLKYLTLAFALFDGEEIGLQGSSAYVYFHSQELVQKNAWMVNFDEIAGGFPLKVIMRGGVPAVKFGGDLIPIFQESIRNSQKLQDKQNKEDLVINAKSFSSQSDHAPFFISSIPSAYLYTRNKKRHSEYDNWEAFKSESVELCGLLIKEFIMNLDDELSRS